MSTISFFQVHEDIFKFLAPFNNQLSKLLRNHRRVKAANLVSGAFMEMLDLLDVTLHLTPLVFFGISSTELHVNRRSNQVISQTSCSFIALASVE